MKNLVGCNKEVYDAALRRFLDLMYSKDFTVDEAIVPILKKVKANTKYIAPVYSCEGHPGETADDTGYFMFVISEVTTDEDIDDFSARISSTSRGSSALTVEITDAFLPANTWGGRENQWFRCVILRSCQLYDEEQKSLWLEALNDFFARTPIKRPKQ